MQFYFEINLKFSNIATQNIFITLRNKTSNSVVKKIVLVEKNVIKFTEERQRLSNVKDLNEIYELFWEISEGQRSGIIHFSYPLKVENGFKVTFAVLEEMEINKLFKINI